MAIYLAALRLGKYPPLTPPLPWIVVNYFVYSTSCLRRYSTWRPHLAGHYGFDANISFKFQAVKNLSAHHTYLHCGLFCKVFWWVLGISEHRTFSKKISKIYVNKELWSFGVVLKLEFGVNPLTPVPPVTARAEPWPFFHFWHHHLWPNHLYSTSAEKKIFPMMPSSQWLAYWNLKYAQKCSKSWAKNSEPNFLPLHLAAPWSKLATSMTLPEIFFNPKQAREMANHSSKKKPRIKRKGEKKFKSRKA